MRRYLGSAVIGSLLLTALAAPPVAIGATTYTVNCGSGGDLQTAINLASDGDTLVISGTCVGNFTVLKALTLVGQGPRPTITGGPVSTAAVLFAPAATITRLTITGGRGDGIYNPGGPLTLIDVTVRDNGGSGIVLHFGSLTMVRSTVSGNGSAGILASGGAPPDDIRQSTVRANGGVGIYNFGVMTLTDSTVRDNVGVGIANVSTLDGRGDLTAVGSTIRGNAGGGIENRWKLSISHSQVMNNATTGLGGGIWNRDEPGPFHLNFSGVLTMSDSMVMGNTAGIDGGGIYNSGPPSDLTLTNVKIKNNTPNDCVGC